MASTCAISCTASCPALSRPHHHPCHLEPTISRWPPPAPSLTPPPAPCCLDAALACTVSPAPSRPCCFDSNSIILLYYIATILYNGRVQYNRQNITKSRKEK